MTKEHDDSVRTRFIVDKYLSTYAEVSHEDIAHLERLGPFSFVLVIPAYREGLDLLNKLAKVGHIKELGGNAIKLSARLSTRVPFGTGPALVRIVDQGDAAPIFYDPRVYMHLRAFIAHNLAKLSGTLVVDDVFVDNDLNQQAFQSLKGHDKIIENLMTRRFVHDRIKAFHSWFDAHFERLNSFIIFVTRVFLCALSTNLETDNYSNVMNGL